MNYISAAEAAEKWGVGLRQVQRLLASDRIPGVNKHGKSWLIPADSEKPGDLRNEKKSPRKSPVLRFLIISFQPRSRPGRRWVPTRS